MGPYYCVIYLIFLCFLLLVYLLQRKSRHESGARLYFVVDRVTCKFSFHLFSFVYIIVCFFATLLLFSFQYGFHYFVSLSSLYILPFFTLYSFRDLALLASFTYLSILSLFKLFLVCLFIALLISVQQQLIVSCASCLCHGFLSLHFLFTRYPAFIQDDQSISCKENLLPLHESVDWHLPFFFLILTNSIFTSVSSFNINITRFCRSCTIRRR